VVIIDIPEGHRAGISDMLYNKFGIAGSTTSGLRLCPHIYNTDAHIDRAIAGVKESLATLS
jgi:selenocysteine lyase/cysteine desulfurase